MFKEKEKLCIYFVQNKILNDEPVWCQIVKICFFEINQFWVQSTGVLPKIQKYKNKCFRFKHIYKHTHKKNNNNKAKR